MELRKGKHRLNIREILPAGQHSEWGTVAILEQEEQPGGS